MLYFAFINVFILGRYIQLIHSDPFSQKCPHWNPLNLQIFNCFPCRNHTFHIKILSICWQGFKIAKNRCKNVVCMCVLKIICVCICIQFEGKTSYFTANHKLYTSLNITVVYFMHVNIKCGLDRLFYRPVCTRLVSFPTGIFVGLLVSGSLYLRVTTCVCVIVCAAGVSCLCVCFLSCLSGSVAPLCERVCVCSAG